MGLEIERKFLVNRPVWEELEKPEGLHCVQCYLVNEPAKTIRIRIIGGKALITIKGKTIHLSRSEFEYEIPLEDAKVLMEQFGGSKIVKTRYLIPLNQHTWEVDVFHEDNAGLIVAEIELESDTETFEHPNWLEKEVSHDSKYFNACLQKNPFKNW